MDGRIQALRIVTTCKSVAELVEEYEAFFDDDSCFLPHRHPRPVDTQVAFSIRLADGTAVIRGAGIVRDSWTDDANPFGRTGMRIGISRIAPQSRGAYERLRPQRIETQSIPITQLQGKTARAVVLERNIPTEREEPLPKRTRRPPRASVHGMRPITRPSGVPMLVLDHGSSTAVAVAPLIWRWWFGVVAFALVVAMLLMR